MKRVQFFTALCLVVSFLCISCSRSDISLTEIKNAVAGSDDFSLYEDVFANSTSDLIKRGMCSLEEVLDQGGWIKSVNSKEEPLYFIYCGGSKQSDKIYLSVETGFTTK